VYGKHFQSTYTGSMYGAGADIFAVWGYVIAHTVKSSLEMNPRMLASLLGMTVERVQAAIDYLSAPDPNSRNTDYEGRRLVKDGAFQYFVPSWERYNKIRDQEARREYNRVKKRESRAKSVAALPEINELDGIVSKCQTLSAMSAKEEVEVEVISRHETAGDKRFASFKEALAAYWKHKNLLVPEMPWEGAEAKQLSSFLAANPAVTLEQFQTLLNNRANSSVAHGERVRYWIGNVTKFSEPLDQYSKPLRDQRPQPRRIVST
jgi:hypothetical protein